MRHFYAIMVYHVSQHLSGFSNPCCVHVQEQVALTGLEVALPLFHLIAAMLLDQAFHKARAPGYMLAAFPMLFQRVSSHRHRYGSNIIVISAGYGVQYKSLDS